MRAALLSEKLSDSVVRCNICQWHCVIHTDKTGVCGMYQNLRGVLYNLNYALASSVAVDPIEKKPLFHFHPGTQVFSLGGWGCNFHCQDCQNWEISMVKDIIRDSKEILPQRAIELAQRNGCAGIAWTYNEPSMWFEYTLDCAKLAKKNNLYTVYVTNGYLSPEVLDIIGPYLDAWRVDIKGFSDTLYRNLAKITNWRGILEVAQRAKTKWNMHVEVVTNIIPTMNDDDEQLGGIAGWIHDKLGEQTPWHVTRFHPNYLVVDVPATPLTTLEHAYELGRKAGLKFVYLGNVPGHFSETTVCSSCGKPVVERTGYQTNVCGLNDSRCRYCGADLNFKVNTGGK
jgi:pyruvate formate lyase activating enzyme